MIVGLKRPSFFEEIYGKRCRLDGLMDLPEDPSCSSCPSSASVEDVIAAVASSLDREKRRTSMDDSTPEPMEKRLRLDSPQHIEGDGCGGSSSNPAREADLRRWSEAVVRALHGCPSVEEAGQRCARVLGDIESEVRQATLREVEQTTPPQRDDDRPQAPQPSNKVLMRAVHHLAERCKRMEAEKAGSEEYAMLRRQLEESQAERRRLAHSNEMLQGHLRLHLDQSGGSSQPWGHALH